MRVQLSFVLAVALGVPSAAEAREPTVLAPLSPWNLHYSDNSCQLFRTFGNAANPTHLAIESLGPDSGLTMLVHGGALSAKQGSGEAKATFVPSTGRTFDDGNVSETTESKKTAIYWGNISLLPETSRDQDRSFDRARAAAMRMANRALEMTAGSNVTAIQIVEPRRRVTVLQTGSLAKVMQMLRECNREQMADWGLDPAVQDRIVLAPEARRNLASLFSAEDYPTLAIRSGQMSMVRARLIVGADGKVTKCTSLTPFTGEGFKEVVCDRLSKAVFQPAELADGTKVPTFVISRVNFRMPGS